MKKMLLLLTALCLTMIGCNKGGSAGGNVKLESDDDKTFYAVGGMFGSRLKDLNLSEKEVNQIAAGLYDAATGKELKVDVATYGPKVQELFKNRMSAKADSEKENGAKYLENFVKNEGGTKTESGLAYKIIKEGEGANPKATDTVEVHYEGKLIDGTVFDSSKERGKTVKFPLNRVIKGWTEGLQLVKPGGQIKLVIPSDLAYGDSGAAPKIPGGATLTFDVELIAIEKADAKKKDKADSHAGHKH